MKKLIILTFLIIPINLSCGQNQKESNIKHLINSINYANSTAELDNQRESFSIIENNEMKKSIEFYKKAFEEGKLVNIDMLNKDHPNFGNHFRDDYLKGLQLLIDGYEKKIDRAYLQGQILLEKWGTWYSANFDNIRARNMVEVIIEHNKNTLANEEPNLNSSELERYSRVLKKAEGGVQNQSDLAELRSLLRDYTSRTGRFLTEEEYNVFIGFMKLTNDYFYELGISLLYSWDQKKILTTTKFDDLYKTMATLKLRQEENLKHDLRTLKAASLNQPYLEDELGQKYEFGKEIILNQMKQNEISNNNMTSIHRIMREFVK